MKCPRVVLFDYDDTLTESFQIPEAKMIERVSELTKILPIAIVTGAGFPRLERDILPHLANPLNVYVFPSNAAQCFVFKDRSWLLSYSNEISPEIRDAVRAALGECIQTMPELTEMSYSGNRISERDGQIAFTATGVEAPLEVKRAWDPSGAKRRAIIEKLQKKVTGLEMSLGGATTIDITRQDVNKAEAVRWLSKKLSIEPSDMLFIGDSIYEGGNDYVVIPTGIETKAVSRPSDTERIIDEILAQCAPKNAQT